MNNYLSLCVITEIQLFHLMRSVFFILSLSLFIPLDCLSQTATKILKVHFLYGSKPAKGHKQTETNWFGGIKGGHVSLELDGVVTGFEPKGKFHVFGNDKDRHSYYAKKPLKDWVADTASLQYLSISIPLSERQYSELKKILRSYQSKTPYDYAFFGYRCAASSYDILAQLDLLKKRGRHSTVIHYFYPKLLRSCLIRKAKKYNYALHYPKGRPSRKWEKDNPKPGRVIKEIVHSNKTKNILQKRPA